MNINTALDLVDQLTKKEDGDINKVAERLQKDYPEAYKLISELAINTLKGS